ncbi:MAG: hypothetical protein ACR2P3_12775 [Geminicoccaceae bacterium]
MGGRCRYDGNQHLRRDDLPVIQMMSRHVPIEPTKSDYQEKARAIRDNEQWEQSIDEPLSDSLLFGLSEQFFPLVLKTDLLLCSR